MQSILIVLKRIRKAPTYSVLFFYINNGVLNLIANIKVFKLQLLTALKRELKK